MVSEQRHGPTGARALRGALPALAGALLLGFTPPLAGRAAALDAEPAILVAADGSRGIGSDWDDGWDDYNRTLLQMQRESISHQEEQAREAGRAVRRKELEQDREKAATEREEYFDAILDASQASLRAPRGVYYRKPGYTSPDPPAESALAVEVGGVSYLYERGVFWLQQGADYLVVTAPVGAVVGALPAGALRVLAAGEPHWYFFGAFFAQRGAAYAVVKPPAGLTVYYLPDGYTREKAGGADVFRFGETLFKPVFVQGVLAYQVVSDR